MVHTTHGMCLLYDFSHCVSRARGADGLLEICDARRRGIFLHCDGGKRRPKDPTQVERGASGEMGREIQQWSTGAGCGTGAQERRDTRQAVAGYRLSNSITQHRTNRRPTADRVGSGAWLLTLIRRLPPMGRPTRPLTPAFRFRCTPFRFAAAHDLAASPARWPLPLHSVPRREYSETGQGMTLAFARPRSAYRLHAIRDVPRPR